MDQVNDRFQHNKKPSQFNNTLGTKGERPREYPLALIILRYFAYVLVSFLCIAGVLLGLFILALTSGFVYPAGYAEDNLSQIEEIIQESDSVNDTMIPSCYYWLHVSSEGQVLAGDMSEAQQDIVQSALASPDNRQFIQNQTTYNVITMKDGSYCALSYQLIPHYVSKELRDGLPNLQNLLLIVAVVLGVAAVVLIAIRAARVISRKLQPLTQSARKIQERELSFTVPASNIKEINETLSSLEQMRSSLKNSLEAQWKVEQAQREQISALVHDLKTPLTIIKGNGELLAETGLNEEQQLYEKDIKEGVRNLETYIEALIELSRSYDGVSLDKQPTNTNMFIKQVILHSQSLARVAHVTISATCSELPESMNIDSAQMERAIMNIVSNAVEHSKEGGTVTIDFKGDGFFDEGESECLTITITDSGSGFSKEALEHGIERFYREDSSRSGSQHFGLGLSIASSIIKQHGGILQLGNAPNAQGAEVVIRIPQKS